MTLPADPVCARELSIWTVNDGDTYRQTTQGVIANLRKHIARGNYDQFAAMRSWRRVAMVGAKSYCREFSCELRDTFPPATRNLAAVEIAEYYQEHLEEPVP